MTAVISADRVSVRYHARAVLADCSFELEAGRSLGIVGSSGAGKSTLLWTLAGLKYPTSGTVTLGTSDLYRSSRSGRLRLRREAVGLVLQHGELVPDLTLAENVALPLRVLGESSVRSCEAAHAMLHKLGIGELAERFPDEVSGGEAQRAAVGRAIVHRPAIVLADEPTGSLDEANSEVVLECLFNLTTEHGAALVLVTHSKDVAARTDAVSHLTAGSLVPIRS